MEHVKRERTCTIRRLSPASTESPQVGKPLTPWAIPAGHFFLPPALTDDDDDDELGKAVAASPKKKPSGGELAVAENRCQQISREHYVKTTTRRNEVVQRGLEQSASMCGSFREEVTAFLQQHQGDEEFRRAHYALAQHTSSNHSRRLCSRPWRLSTINEASPRSTPAALSDFVCHSRRHSSGFLSGEDESASSPSFSPVFSACSSISVSPGTSSCLSLGSSDCCTEESEAWSLVDCTEESEEGTLSTSPPRSSVSVAMLAKQLGSVRVTY